ncbi:hypothetical protein AGMMS50267_00290 [Spirochaetia bacterium]|nr:hypothetical protein AGMMS50267_00290 [Spirochaetia bacterium]
MKKAIFLSLAVSVVFFAVSCKSGPATEHDDSFSQVYNAYRGNLILNGAKEYIVVAGDTLSKITTVQYGAGNGYFFPLIMLASSDVVEDPDLIVPGMKLTIPNLQANLDDPTARKQLKEFLLDIADVYEKKGDPRSLATRHNLIELAGTL